MEIRIFPCQGRCNVSMMTKTVTEFFHDENTVFVLPNLYAENDSFSTTQVKYLAVNGCSAKCASKEFEFSLMQPDGEVVITKDFDPKNNEKYAELLNIDEEVSLVQEAIDQLL